MDNLQIRANIASNTDVKNHMERLWTSIVVLRETVGLSESTMKELEGKIRKKIAACDFSIQYYSKLLLHPDSGVDKIETEQKKSIEDLEQFNNHPQL